MELLEAGAEGRDTLPTDPIARGARVAENPCGGVAVLRPAWGVMGEALGFAHGRRAPASLPSSGHDRPASNTGEGGFDACGMVAPGLGGEAAISSFWRVRLVAAYARPSPHSADVLAKQCGAELL